MKKINFIRVTLISYMLIVLSFLLTGCIPSLIENVNFFADKVDYTTYEIEVDKDDVPILKTESGTLKLGILQDEDDSNVPMKQYYSITFTPLNKFYDLNIYSVVLFLRAEKDCILSITLWLSPTEFMEKEISLKATSMQSLEWSITGWKDKYDENPIMLTLNNPFDVGDTKWLFDNVMFCSSENI